MANKIDAGEVKKFLDSRPPNYQEYLKVKGLEDNDDSQFLYVKEHEKFEIQRDRLAREHPAYGSRTPGSAEPRFDPIHEVWVVNTAHGKYVSTTSIQPHPLPSEPPFAMWVPRYQNTNFNSKNYPVEASENPPPAPNPKRQRSSE